MKKNLTVSVVTPVYNAEKFISRAISSVLSQSGNFNLQYIIVDGASSDNTISVIKNTFTSFPKDKKSRSALRIVSEPDMGIYDALCKGFRLCTGDVICYLNSDDFFQPRALETVTEIFTKFPDVKWLTGIQTSYNVKGQIIDAFLPYKYKNSLIQQGYYGTFLPFIQQESTYWRSELMEKVNFDRLRQFKLAGDFFLWKTFSTVTELTIAQCVLSGFSKHPGQKSAQIKKYYSEMREISDGKTPLSFIDALMQIPFSYFIPNRTKKYVNKKLIYFDVSGGTWARKAGT